jgi:hypothetical protein
MAITERYIVVCDEIRREDNGKLILLGVYFREIIVQALPLTIPSLTFLCVLESDQIGDVPFRWELRHEDSGGHLGDGNGIMHVRDLQQQIIMPLKFPNLNFQNQGLYTLSIQCAGQDPILSTINVRRAPIVIPGAPPTA